jgi:hypothetical protein
MSTVDSHSNKKLKLLKCLNQCFARLRSLHWAAANLKGKVEFQNKENLDHLLQSFLTQKCWFQDLRFQSSYSMSSRWCGLG